MTAKSERPIIVTRPSGQADELLAQASELSNEVRHHPLIDIHSFDDDGSIAANAARRKILDIDRYDAVIAISRNAAECGLTWLDDYWPQYPVGIRWYGVGPTTVEVMRAGGLEPEMPESRFDSEGVLELPSLQNIEQEKILIWRGVGGRETLASVLRQRNAHVDYAELYERRQIDWSQTDWDSTLTGSPLLILSSGQALDIAEQQVRNLKDRITALLVPSERVATYAREQGYRDVIVAASARNEDTLHSLRAWLAAAR